MRHTGKHGRHRAFAAILLAGLAVGAKAAEQATSFTLPLASLPDGYSLEVGAWSTGYCGRHLGQDIPIPANTPVYAVANGVVKFSEDIGGLGHAINIEHELPDGSKVVSVYYHLVREGRGGILLEPNTDVVAGQLIARTTGYSPDYGTGPHLHFAIRPGSYLRELDPRTNKWFYPGYTSIYSRRNDASSRECNQIDVRHDEIVSEWINDPIQYVNDHSIPTTPSTTFTLGDRVEVSPAANPTVNVRDAANGNVLGTQTPGTQGAIVGGPVWGGGYWWWQVDFDSGVDGWVAEAYLSKQNALTNVSIAFRVNPPFEAAPSILRGGLALTEQVTTVVHASLYDGSSILGNTDYSWATGNGSGWAFFASDCTFFNGSVDFSSIRDGSIDGRFELASDVPFSFDASSVLVDLTNCDGTQIVGSGTVTSVTVNGNLVYPPTPLPGGVTIDFNHLPDGTPTDSLPNLTHVDGLYSSLGVSFNSIDGDGGPTFSHPSHPNSSQSIVINDFSRATGTFSIVAEFSPPVISVSADVLAAAGRSVRMTARDSTGTALAVTESSSTTTASYPFKGNVSISGVGSITRVEWEAVPDPNISGVGIDNLTFGR